MPRGTKELAEQITPELREVEVEVGRGKTVLEAVKKIGVMQPKSPGLIPRLTPGLVWDADPPAYAGGSYGRVLLARCVDAVTNTQKCRSRFLRSRAWPAGRWRGPAVT
jgi:hypothetical protein